MTLLEERIEAATAALLSEARNGGTRPAERNVIPAARSRAS